MTPTILEYTDAHAAAFRDINAEWIAAMFTLEPHDAYVLSHPREAILDPGGVILLVADETGAIVGAGALMKTAPGVFELTKMGVRAEARGLKAGGHLLAALLARAAAMSVETLYLLTSSRCAAAIHLYEKLGFVHDSTIMAAYGATYARCDVALRYLRPPAEAIAAAPDRP